VVHCAAESYVPTRRARLAVTVHDAAFFEPDGAAHRGGWVQRAKWRLLYRRLAKRADLFHTVSHFSAARLAHHVPAIADRLRVVHNAVTPLFFAPTTAAGQAYLDAEGLADRPFVLLPRGLHYRKNADLVLEAWPAVQQQHPDVRLVVTSHNDPAYVARARARFGDDVVITDFISDDALHALYGAACVTWMPSRYEGFGLPVLESMARGTPVVASDSSSLPEVAGEAALLVPPTDADAHVQALEALLRDPALRDDLRARGRARAEQFTWRRAADDMYAHFQTLL
jgi:glycosyltransferase involved in cell wall biosynthesis